MGIFSLLPESMQTIELWIIRIFVRLQCHLLTRVESSMAQH
jgi:hypothetical protein